MTRKQAFETLNVVYKELYAIHDAEKIPDRKERLGSVCLDMRQAVHRLMTSRDRSAAKSGS